MLGQTPPSRVFGGDLSNTPSKPQQRSHRPGRSGRAGPPATTVQRFSVRSRRAHPYAGGVSPSSEMCQAYPAMKVPPSVAGCPAGGIVRSCPCSWQRALLPNRHRLCQRDTEEHAEFGLLQAMGRRFRQELGIPAWAVSASSVAGRAATRELDVHFVLQPDGQSDNVVGYVAFSRAEETSAMARGPGGSSPPELVQIYVEPQFRRRGIATQALGVLLAGQTGIMVSTKDVEAPNDNEGQGLFGAGNGLPPAAVGVARLLTPLGFQQDARGTVVGNNAQGRVLYQRRLQIYGGGGDENVL